MVEFTVLMTSITAYRFARQIISEVFILKIALTIVQLILAVALVCIVMFQQGRTQGLGAISGAGDTFLSKNKSKSLDATLAKLTTVIAAVFIVITLVLNLSIIG